MGNAASLKQTLSGRAPVEPVQADPAAPVPQALPNARRAELVPLAPAPATTLALGAKVEYAKLLAASGLLPAQYRNKPANLLWAIEYGEMLGLSPMAAINGVHMIEGKPSASAGLIGALVRRAGHRLQIRGDDESATCTITRSDDDEPFTVTWTLARAKQAELLGKDNWRKYPAAMLKARAVTECARDACEEALSGVRYTPEELGAVVDVDGDVTWELEPEPAVAQDGPTTNWAAVAEQMADADGIRDVWRRARDAGQLTKDLEDILNELVTARALEADREEPAEDGIEDAVVVPDEPVDEEPPAAEGCSVRGCVEPGSHDRDGHVDWLRRRKQNQL